MCLSHIVSDWSGRLLSTPTYWCHHRQLSQAHAHVTAIDEATHSLTLFNDVIEKNVGDDSEQPERDILMAPRMKFYVDSNNIVYTVKEL